MFAEPESYLVVGIHPDVVGGVLVGCCGNVAMVLDGVLLHVVVGMLWACCWGAVGMLWGCCWDGC